MSRPRTQAAALAKRKPKGAYHHGDLRQALVEASSDLVARHGAVALTLRAVAARLGVSHAAPRHHFKDQPELLAAVAARGFERFADALGEAAARQTDPVARLEATGIAYVRFALAEPELFRLMFGRGQTALTPELLAASARAFDVLVAEARGALAGTGAGTDRLELVTTTSWSVVHGLATLLLDRRLPLPADGDVERLAAEVTHLVAGALGPE
jgi:AcrR family transcriptional regulator